MMMIKQLPHNHNFSSKRSSGESKFSPFAKLTILLVFLVSQMGYSQQGVFSDVEYSAEVNLRLMAFSGDELPFWMYSNQRDRVLPGSLYSTWASGSARTYLTDDSFLEAGAGFFARNGDPGGVGIDELYAHYENQYLRITAGSKQREVLYNGLSATNENILWSLNARPLPGIQVGTNGPIFIGETDFGFEASWNEYFLGEDRFMSGAQLHHKSFHLTYRNENELEVRAGFQHWAHYGGSAADGRDRPLTEDYLDAVTLVHPSQHHLSTYELSISQGFEDYRLELLYNNIAVDRTGRRFGNTPDGRYGIYYETNEPGNIINSAIYELYTTHHQSHTSTGFPIDDYFNHWVYRSGWAYQGRVLGAPFFTYDPEEQTVINNKFTAHHIGIGGQFGGMFDAFPYKFLLSYARNKGTYENRFTETQDRLSMLYDMLVFDGFAEINVQVGADFSAVNSPQFGLGVHFRRRF